MTNYNKVEKTEQHDVGTETQIFNLIAKVDVETQRATIIVKLNLVLTLRGARWNIIVWNNKKYKNISSFVCFLIFLIIFKDLEEDTATEEVRTVSITTKIIKNGKQDL